jgi:hypothetical protein
MAIDWLAVTAMPPLVSPDL